MTDLSGTNWRVVRNRVKKTVRQYATDEPARFWVIAALVPAIAGRLVWTPKT